MNKVPSGADFVAVAHLDPAASQKMNLFRMTEKFPDLGSEEQLSQKVDGLLDDALSGSGLTREDLGWVGGEVGGYADVGAGSPSYAVMVASDDNGAASSALQKMRDASGTTYTSSTVDGVEVWAPATSDQPTEAIVDDTVVLASSPEAMQTVITTGNGDTTIQDDATFTGVMDKLPDDNLGFVYVNVGSIASLASLIPGQAGGLASQLDAYQGAAYSISAESDGLAIDAAVTTDPSKLTAAQRDALGSGPNPLLALTPADAYAVVASSGIGSALEDSVTQAAQLGPGPARTIERLGLIGPNGVLQHLTGDLGLQVGPGSGLLPVGGTAMVGIDDAAAVQTWLDKHVPGLLSHAGVPGLSSGSLKTEEYQGVRITYGATPTTPIAWGVVDRALVVGLSPKSVEAGRRPEPRERLGDHVRRGLHLRDRRPARDADAPLRRCERDIDCGTRFPPERRVSAVPRRRRPEPAADRVDRRGELGHRDAVHVPALHRDPLTRADRRDHDGDLDRDERPGVQTR